MVACVGAFTVYLVGVAEKSYFSTLHEGVEAQARLVSVAAQPCLLTPERRHEADALAKQFGRQSGVRVTIIEQSGVVLGDSEGDPLAMENHGDRPEVLAALRREDGSARRQSATLGYGTLYVAVPISEGDRLLGVARVALSLDRVDRATQQIAWAIVLGGLVSTALAAALGLFIARGVTGPIDELTAVADRMAEGELDQQIGHYSGHEVGRLARAFSLMADRLRTTIKAITSERDTLASVLSTMADGILIVDGNGQVAMANRSASVLLRSPTSVMEGRSYVEALRDHELSAVLQRCLEQGSPQTGTAEVGPGRRFLRIVATPLRGQPYGALALLQDLTEVRRVERVRRDFIANVSHELRTPLTSLKALVETLEEGALDDPPAARDFLAKMHSEVDGLAQLVGELLELSRIESGQVSLHLEPVDVEPLTRKTADRFLAQATRAGLKLSVEAPADLPTVLADPQRIEQVLVNLIHNAIKFTPSGGEIVVGARKEADGLVLWVADNGVGISAEDLPRIFERFYKADRSRSNGGTGLGLAIAKHLVEAHGGRIWAESIEGRGSTFAFTLPGASAEC